MKASASSHIAADRVRVRDAMSWPALALPLNHGVTAGRVLQLAADNAVHHFIVLRASKLVGVVCTCDLIEAAPASAIEPLMTTHVITVRDASQLWKAVAQMDDFHVNCLPTFSQGAWGIVTRGDLERAGACGRPRCFGCLARHHLRAHPFYAEQWFCRDCLPSHDEFSCWYEDHGGGD